MKRLFQLFAIACIVMLIAACGNDDNSDEESTDDSSSDEGTEETTDDSGDDSSEDESTDVEDPDESDEESTESEGSGSTTENGGTANASEENSEDNDTTIEEEVSTEENMTDGEEATKTFVLEQDGMTNTLGYTYVDDEVKIQTSETTASYEDIGAEDEESAREILEPLVEDYQDTEGVEHNIEYDDEGFHETLEVNYEVADISEVANLEGSEFEGDTDNAQFIRMTQTEQQLLNSGYQLE